MSDGMGCVYLVGAGCGGIELLTLRGLELLRRCDAVVYDDLIDMGLLEAVPAGAERIYMGKRSGRHSAAQAEICAVLFEKAQAGKTVVRLKGGDPFVFGRGGEELLALRAAGVPCEAVPGVSSAVAIPELAGIPVTHRGLSRSFHVVTAHTANTPDGLPEDFDRLAGLSGTLVFLMGLEHLAQISARLTAAGMATETPAAVVSGGNAPRPAVVRGTLGDIAERAAGVAGPAVIVVGETAALELVSTVSRPLAGVTVALTGTDAFTAKLCTALEALGGRTFTAQRSVVRELTPALDLERICECGAWLVFTSGNGVEAFFRRLRALEFDLRRLWRCRFAVIGRATAAKLESYGVYPELCPEEFTSEALGRLLRERVPKGAAIYLLRSRDGSAVLRELLADAFDLRDVALYAAEADVGIARAAEARLAGADFLVFASAGGVEMFFQAHRCVPEGAVCVCIGRVTAEALGRRYRGRILTASEASAEGIVEVIVGCLKE